MMINKLMAWIMLKAVKMERIEEIYLGEEKTRIDVFTSQFADITRSRAAKLIEDGCVLIDGKKASKNDKLTNGSKVVITLPDPVVYDIKPENIPLDIVFEDDDLFFANGYQAWTTSREFSKNDKGFVSFESAYKDENAYIHYSTIDEIGWMIALVRYDSQVFAKVSRLIKILSYQRTKFDIYHTQSPRSLLQNLK